MEAFFPDSGESGYERGAKGAKSRREQRIQHRFAGGGEERKNLTQRRKGAKKKICIILFNFTPLREIPLLTVIVDE